MAIRQALGTLNGPVYFTNRDGEVSLPPTDDVPTPPGWERHQATTLAEVDALQRRLQEIERRNLERSLAHDEASFAAARKRVYDSLYAKMISSGTAPFEREFIRYYLMLREERREKFQKEWLVHQAVLEMREYDRPRDPHELLRENPHAL